MAALILTSSGLLLAAGVLIALAVRARESRLRRGAAVVGALVFLGAFYGVAIEPRFVLSEQQERAAIPGLPEPWRGKTVALIGDLQVGMWGDNLAMARRAVGVIVDRAPAAVLIAGDFVYGSDDVSTNVETAVDIVRPLPEAGIPTYAVLGNHDYESGAAGELRPALEEAGVQLLANEVAELDAEGETLFVVGLAPKYGDRADPDEALDGLASAAPRVVLMHDPDVFETLPAGSAPLAVAGHTHGGQLRVPFAHHWSYLGWLEEHTVHTDGWAADGFGAADNRLFVSRGIGMSALPMRVNCSPAVTFFTLEGP